MWEMMLRGVDHLRCPPPPGAGSPPDGAIAASSLGQPGSLWSPEMLVKGMQRAPGGKSTGMAATSVDLEQHQPSLSLSFPFCKLGVTGQQLHTQGGGPPQRRRSGPRTRLNTQPQGSCCALSLLFLFFSFIFVSWRLITLQYCSGFGIH